MENRNSVLIVGFRTESVPSSLHTEIFQPEIEIFTHFL